MKVKSESEVVQSCLTLSDPMDCSPPGSSVHGIFQARVLEWGAIAFSARILEWITISFSRGGFPTQGLNLVSCIVTWFFTTELLGKPLNLDDLLSLPTRAS